MLFSGSADSVKVDRWRRWWTLVAAKAGGVSVSAAYRWLDCFRAGGERVFRDARLALRRAPRATPAATIAQELGSPRSVGCGAEACNA